MTGLIGFHRGSVILGLVVYALGLLPFYYLTPVHNDVQLLIRPPDRGSTVSPASTATPIVTSQTPPARAATTAPVATVSAIQSSASASPASASPLETSTAVVTALAEPTTSAGPPVVQPVDSMWLMYAAKGDLWETNGTQTVQLTHSGRLSQPTLGQDVVVYVERQRNYSDLWVARPGAVPARITNSASSDIGADHWLAQPSAIPAEGRIDVLSDQNKDTTGAGDLAIWSLNLASGVFHQITQPPPYTGGDQDVTPDPRDPGTIVFTRYVYAADGQLIEALEWLGSGSDQTVALTTPDHPSRQASFAPDGATIAFVQTDGRNDNLYLGQVVTTPVAGLDGVQKIATGTIAEPVWSPDGTALAYISLTDHTFQLWVLPIDRGAAGAYIPGAARQITTGDGVDAASRPVWLSSAMAADIPHWFTATH